MAAGDGEPPFVADTDARPVVTTIDQRTAQVEGAALKLRQAIARRSDAPPIVVPLLQMSAVQSPFTLADITDTDRFRKLGRSLAADPDGELARTLVSTRQPSRPSATRPAAGRTTSRPIGRSTSHGAICSRPKPTLRRRKGRGQPSRPWGIHSRRLESASRAHGPQRPVDLSACPRHPPGPGPRTTSRGFHAQSLHRRRVGRLR